MDYIICASRDASIKLWELESNNELMVLNGHADWVSCLAVLSEVDLLASGSYDHKIMVWRISTGENTSTMTLDNWVLSLKFFKDGASLLSLSKGGSIQVWATDTGVNLQTLNIPDQTPVSISYARDFSELVVVSGWSTIYTYNCSDVGVTQGSPATAKLVRSVKICAICHSPDGQLIVTGARDGMLQLWSCSDLRVASLIRGHHGAIKAVTFNSDASLLASASQCGEVKLWRVDSRELLLSLTTLPGTYSIAFSADGCEVAVSRKDGFVQRWDAFTGTDRGGFFSHNEAVLAVAYSSERGGSYI